MVNKVEYKKYPAQGNTLGTSAIRCIAEIGCRPKVWEWECADRKCPERKGSDILISIIFI